MGLKFSTLRKYSLIPTIQFGSQWTTTQDSVCTTFHSLRESNSAYRLRRWLCGEWFACGSKEYQRNCCLLPRRHVCWNIWELVCWYFVKKVVEALKTRALHNSSRVDSIAAKVYEYKNNFMVLFPKYTMFLKMIILVEVAVWMVIIS